VSHDLLLSEDFFVRRAARLDERACAEVAGMDLVGLLGVDVVDVQAVWALDVMADIAKYLDANITANIQHWIHPLLCQIVKVLPVGRQKGARKRPDVYLRFCLLSIFLPITHITPAVISRAIKGIQTNALRYILETCFIGWIVGDTE